MGDAIDRNFDRWPVLGQYVYANDFIGATYQAELDFFKGWLIDRLDWMDQNMVGDCDSYVTKVSKNQQEEIRIFPNPSAQYLNFSIEQDQPMVLEIFNLESQLIQSIQLAPNNNSVDISSLNNGLYTVIFKSAKDQSIVFIDKLAIVK